MCEGGPRYSAEIEEGSVWTGKCAKEMVGKAQKVAHTTWFHELYEQGIIDELLHDLEFPQREVPDDVVIARSRDSDSTSRHAASACCIRDSSRCRRPCSLAC